jgi:hypothetical protein
MLCAVETFRIGTIENTLDKGVYLWGMDEEEQWAEGKPYPHSVITDHIQFWPKPPTGSNVRFNSPNIQYIRDSGFAMTQDRRWLCDVNDEIRNWVGTYPIINNKPSKPVGSIKPGFFRALISRRYNTVGAGKKAVHTFAFCGLVSKIINATMSRTCAKRFSQASHFGHYSKDAYKMCWPQRDLREGTSEQAVLV